MSTSTFHPVRTRRSFEEAVSQILDGIRSGELHIGDRLPSERDLSATMEISRPTLREAIRLLSDAGVVAVKRGSAGGTYVASEVIPVELVEKRAKLPIGEVAGVLEARRMIEPRVAQLTALYATDADIEAMESTVAAQEQSIGDRDLFNQLNTRFHLTMASATHNKTIAKLMRSLLKDLEIARDVIRGREDPQWSVEIHRRTLAAIKRGDYDEIEAAMDTHLSFLEDLWERERGRPRLRRPPSFLVPEEQTPTRTA